MSSFYEQMISAAMDAQVAPTNGSGTNSLQTGNIKTGGPAFSSGSRLSFPHHSQTMIQQQQQSDQENAKTPLQQSEISSNSSSATAITILTPEPTESSSAGGSPRSMCSTLISEQPDAATLVSEHDAAEKAIVCAECGNFFDGVGRQPKILDCIHTFCEPCLSQRQIQISNSPPHVSIACPLHDCGQITIASSISALQTNIPALTMSIVARAIQHQTSPAVCSCSSESATYLCFSCHQLICNQCCATGHSTARHNIEPLHGLNLSSIDGSCVSQLVDRLRHSRATTPSHMTVMCPKHPSLPVFSYCETCSQPVCKDCTPDHFSTKVGDNVTIHLLKNFDAQTYKHECGFFAAYIKHIREAVTLLRNSLDQAQRSHALLQQQHHDSNVAVLQQFDQYAAKAQNLHKLYAEQGDDFLSNIQLAGGLDKFMNDVNQLREECRRLHTLFERARENCSAAEMSSLRDWVKRKTFDIRQRCRSINQSFNVKRRHSLPLDVRPLVDNELPKLFDTPRLDSKVNHNDFSHQLQSIHQHVTQSQQQHFMRQAMSRNRSSMTMPPQQTQPVWPNASSAMAPAALSNPAYLRIRHANLYADQNIPVCNLVLPRNYSTETLIPGSNFENTPSTTPSPRGCFMDLAKCQDSESNHDNCQEHVETGVVTDSPLLMAPTSVAIPNRLQLRYIAKIGQFGEADGQFTEPSGIATNQHNQLVVADTNSHRIQVFNNHGAFLWRFGECGKRAGQVLYPNRIAIGPEGEYVFTERAPQCLVQVFDQNGTFIRRFGSGDLRHPRGLCIDPEGHVLVLECQVMSVTIYDMRGTRLKRFTFDGIRFPSSICVNDQQEIFIADNIQHYVYVYSYEGKMKRRIGGYPTINFPVGVAINHLGQLVVADNHNNFNITVFTQDGTPISGYESCVKHAQVLDVCLLNAGRAVAISCKDFRVYVYPYQDCTPALADASSDSVNC